MCRDAAVCTAPLSSVDAAPSGVGQCSSTLINTAPTGTRTWSQLQSMKIDTKPRNLEFDTKKNNIKAGKLTNLYFYLNWAETSLFRQGTLKDFLSNLPFYYFVNYCCLSSFNQKWCRKHPKLKKRKSFLNAVTLTGRKSVCHSRSHQRNIKMLLQLIFSYYRVITVLSESRLFLINDPKSAYKTGRVKKPPS